MKSHKGAFYLAEKLQLDIYFTLHGTAIRAQRNFRAGRSTDHKFLQPLGAGDLRFGATYTIGQIHQSLFKEEHAKLA